MFIFKYGTTFKLPWNQAQRLSALPFNSLQLDDFTRRMSQYRNEYVTSCFLTLAVYQKMHCYHVSRGLRSYELLFDSPVKRIDSVSKVMSDSYFPVEIDKHNLMSQSTLAAINTAHCRGFMYFHDQFHEDYVRPQVDYVLYGDHEDTEKIIEYHKTARYLAQNYRLSFIFQHMSLHGQYNF